MLITDFAISGNIRASEIMYDITSLLLACKAGYRQCYIEKLSRHCFLYDSFIDKVLMLVYLSRSTRSVAEVEIRIAFATSLENEQKIDSMPRRVSVVRTLHSTEREAAF